MPVVTAKRRSNCSYCKLQILPGERIDFTRATGAKHLACADDRDDPETMIVGQYEAATEGACGLTDRQAFDLCAEEHGYVNTVRALYRVSEYAKQREDEYRARTKR